MLAETNATLNNNWRKHWFVKNVLAEIPIIGSFFSTKTCVEMFHDAGKCTAMFVGGTIAMVLSMPSTADPTTEADNRGTKVTLISSMAAGMMLGKIAYNGTCEGGAILYQYVAKKRTTEFSPIPTDVPMESRPTNVQSRKL